jgi:hypothetical protein
MDRRDTPRRVSPGDEEEDDERDRDRDRERPREARDREGTGPRFGSGRDRFARLVSASLPTERRLAFRKLGPAVAAGVLALAAIGVIGSHVVGRVVRWLHDRPPYQTTFAAIDLEPPPPSYYRGGREAFLGRVRALSHRPEGPFSALDVELEGLARDFRLYGWVRGVGLIERASPNRLTVHLEYRKPVAWAELPGEKAPALLDAEGVILPFGEADAERNGHLVTIRGIDHPLIQVVGLDPPFEPRPGHVWKDGDAPDAGGRVLAAVSLAAFFNAKLDREPRPIPRVLQPVFLHSLPEGGLFVQNAENSMLYWPEGPGLPSNDQRWADLHRWIRGRASTDVRRPNYLDFTKDGVVVKKGNDRPR